MTRLILYYFIACFSFFLLFSSGFVDSQDGLQYLAIARRMYFDHTFEMPTASYPDDNIHMSVVKTKDGKVYSPTGFGYSVALLPAVALSDVIERFAHAQPVAAFPLQSDWPELLFASMTNAFWGGVLAVVLFLYICSFGFSLRTSLLWGFLLIVTSNLFAYTKYSFAHMIFIVFSVLTMYCIRRTFLTRNNKYMVLVGVFFGLTLIAYNVTFWFLLPPMAVYYLLLSWRENYFEWKNTTRQALLFAMGVLPFIVIYWWFNTVRFGNGITTGYSALSIFHPPAYVVFEGIWGLFFSPGRSFLLYSPYLLLLLLFWFKLRKKYVPELISFSLLAFFYIFFIGTLLGDVDYLVWHGESSWGPRYMTPVVAFLGILVPTIVNKLSRWQKLLVVAPILLVGFWIELIGMIFPYQIKFAGLQTDDFMNGRNLNVYEYGNFIPRYSPVFTMSKTLVRRIRDWRQLYNPGVYNLELHDGFNFPFRIGWAVWREVLPLAEVNLSGEKVPIENISFQIRNHQMDPSSSYSAYFTAQIKNQTNEKVLLVPYNQEKRLTIDVPEDERKDTMTIDLSVSFLGTSSALLKNQQVVFLTDLLVNGQSQPLTTISYPYVSAVSKEAGFPTSRYWGSFSHDPWQIWHMHSGVYENTPDLWWLRPLHYWDFPKMFFFGLFGLTIIALVAGVRGVLRNSIQKR